MSDKNSIEFSYRFNSLKKIISHNLEDKTYSAEDVKNIMEFISWLIDDTLWREYTVKKDESEV